MHCKHFLFPNKAKHTLQGTEHFILRFPLSALEAADDAVVDFVDVHSVSKRHSNHVTPYCTCGSQCVSPLFPGRYPVDLGPFPRV